MIPLSVSSGQFQWTLRRKDDLPPDNVRANLALIGRSEQVDIEKGTVNNYACQNCCPGSFGNGYVIPGNIEVEFEDMIQYEAHETGTNCYGFSYDHVVTDAGWSSDNEDVATVDDFGWVTTHAVGETEIEAEWRVTRYEETEPCGGPYRPTNQDGPEDECNSRDTRKGKGGGDTANRPGCGSCAIQFYTISPDSDLSVKPKITINGPATAKDGDTVTFSVTSQGGTPTSYLWSFEVPSGAGNNPQVNFTAPTSDTTDAKAHWFAKPNSDCPSTPPAVDTNHPYYNSSYTIKLKAIFPGGREIKKEKSFVVNAFWFPIGYVAPPAFSGYPDLQRNSQTGVWYVAGPGNVQRVTNAAVISAPTSSQFFNKTVQHEHVHEVQYQNGILVNLWTVSSFMNAISSLTATSRSALTMKIAAEHQNWDTAESNNFNLLKPQAEREAHAVSDLIAPLYAYQNCGRY